jgi:hypothetical protein
MQLIQAHSFKKNITMKKLNALFFFVIASIAISSCTGNTADVSLTYTDSEKYYSMYAHFNKGKTRDVEKYMDTRIGNTSNTSFVNTKVDGTISLDDHTMFYIKKYPGYIKIKLDKDENSEESYYRIKSMCEGMEKIIK